MVLVVLALVLSCLLVVEVRNGRSHKDLLGRVKPPPIGPETTIMVAAIQVRARAGWWLRGLDCVKRRL